MFGCSSSQVLSVSSNELVSKCGLDTLLPPGRLNGLHNMIQLIQNQVKEHNRDGLTTDIIEPVSEQNKKISSQGGVAEGKESDRDTRNETVAVLLSGGVDSSVALQLLLLQGYKVKAFYLKIWLVSLNPF